MIYFMNTNQNVETAKTHEPSSLMWSHQWKVQGGEGRGGQGVGLVAAEVKKETENIVAAFACMPMT